MFADGKTNLIDINYGTSTICLYIQYTQEKYIWYMSYTINNKQIHI